MTFSSIARRFVWGLCLVIQGSAFSQSAVSISKFSGEISHHAIRHNVSSLNLLSDYLNLDFQQGIAYWDIALVHYQNGNYEDAVSCIFKAFNSIRHNPEQVSRLYCFRGIVRFEAGDLQAAKQDLSIAIQINPLYSMAYEYRARVCLEQRLFEETLENIAYAIPFTADSSLELADLLHLRGWTYYETGRLDEALDNFTEALVYDPDNSDLWWNMGGVHADKQEFHKAVLDYSAAIRCLNGDSLDLASLYHWRGYYRIYDGDLIRAISDLKQAINIYPDYGQAMWNLGYAYERLNKPDSAVVFLLEALPYYQPDSIELPRLLNSLGYNLCEAGKAREGREYLEMALSLWPADGLIRWNLGYANGLLKEYDLALDYYRDAQRFYLNDSTRLADILSSIGYYECESGQYLQGIETLESALKANPGLQRTYDNLIHAYYKAGFFHKLIQFCVTAREKWPSDPGFQRKIEEYIILGYINLNELEKALANLDTYQISNPHRAWGVWHRSGVYYKQKEYSKVIGEMNRFFEIEKDSAMLARGHLRSAECFVITNKHQKAIEEIKIALKVQPESGQARLNQARFVMADLFLQAGEENHAKEILTESMRYDSSACYELARIHMDKRSSDSARYFFMASLRHPMEDSSAFAFTLFFLGDTSAAIKFQLSKLERCTDGRKKKIILYNLACLYSLSRDAVKSCYYLQLAIDNGYSNGYWIREDQDLQFLRRSPEFKKLTLPE